MVHQHFLQIKTFSVLENIILGLPGKNRFSADYRAEEAEISALAKRFGLNINLHANIEDLPIGARQKVEILKALFRGVEILILDEPTTNLTPQEVDDLFHSLREMVNEGLSIVFITHKLREVLAVCDRISVLRNGKNVLTLDRDEANEEAFVRAMVGDEMNIENSIMFSDRAAAFTPDSNKPPVLDLSGVTLTSADGVERIKNIALQVHPGEILGIAGVAGNGQLELAEAVTRVHPISSGKILLNGKDVTSCKTDELFDLGVSYIPEDRLGDGFLPKASVAHNLILGYHKVEPYAKGGFVNWDTVYKRSDEMIERYNIKTQGSHDVGANLSGGNIQRVMIARAIEHSHALLVAHNPTRGLDIPSMDAFYNILIGKQKQGMGILLISENLDELLLLCDRIAVLYRGEVTGVLERSKFEKYEIGRMMSGVRTVA
jgi:simple sugar transport system ATP-binding protein